MRKVTRSLEWSHYKLDQHTFKILEPQGIMEGHSEISIVCKLELAPSHQCTLTENITPFHSTFILQISIDEEYVFIVQKHLGIWSSDVIAKE